MPRHRYFRCSVLAGNVRTRCDAIKTELSLDSDEPPKRVAQLIKMTGATCFTLAALRNPAPVALAQAMGAAWRAPHLTAPGLPIGQRPCHESQVPASLGGEGRSSV